MNTYVQQIYNGAAMLEGFDHRLADPMDRHMLRTALFRIRVALGEVSAPDAAEEAAAAYMAGYEDESK